MDFNQYQIAAMRTAGESNELNCILGLNGEAGEIADYYKKHLFQGHELDKKEVALELGDCLWYIAVMAESIGYDLECIAKMNKKKLEKRYPNGFEVEKSINRVKG